MTTTRTPVLLSVNVGLPKNVPWLGEPRLPALLVSHVTPLLSGDVTYSPDPLEPPADGEVLICCARPGTDIVLDM